MTKYDVPLGDKKNNPVWMLLEHIKPGSNVLEFGCANGRMTKIMHEQLSCSVSIVEYDEAAIRDAAVYAEQAVCGDIMAFEWLEAFAGKQYDHIVFADVLEHLPQPEKVISACLQLLKDDGSFLISLPNIAHNDILNRLWQDEFHYTETGLLDNTHVKFWSYKALAPFFEECGLRIVWEDAVVKESNTTEQYVSGNTYLPELNSRPLGNVYEFVLKAVRRDYAEENRLEKQSMVALRSTAFHSRIYMDKGNGFVYDEPLVVFHDCNTGSLCLEIAVPGDAVQLRIDPIDNACCLLEGVSITDEAGRDLQYLLGNGFRAEDVCVFGHTDPQIYIPLSQGQTGTVYVRARKITFDKEKIVDELCRLLQDGPDANPAEIHQQLASPLLQGVYEKRKGNQAFYAWNAVLDRLSSIENAQKQEAAQLEAYAQKTQALAEKLQEQKQEFADLNFMSQNVQRTTNDMLYVMQHSPWYQRALRRAEQPTAMYRLARALRSHGFFGTGRKVIKKIIQKIYKFSRRHKCLKALLKRVKKLSRKLFPKWEDSVDSVLYEAKLQMNQQAVAGSAASGSALYWSGEKPVPFTEMPLVSVIVPNYNHSAYLADRLESIYNQTYPNFEVILLDDRSTDNSREILMEYANRYPEKTIVDFNEVNGGKVFKQWNKGIDHARGELIWIAESDDWCELDFLEKMVPQFQYQSVMLAFCNSIFMQDGQKIWSLGEYLSDIPGICFDKPFMMSAHTAVNTAFAIKNIVPNVSSAMFRNVGQIPAEITDIWQNIKLCGDWLFYLHTIKGGTISYTNATTNYYRIHKNSTSLKIQRSPEYYGEQEQISRYIVEHFDVDRAVFEKVLYNLEQHYQAVNETEDVTVVRENYRLDRIAEAAGKRQPSVLMCCFSLQMGGGETYPLFLANEMKRQGVCVSVLNFDMDGYSQEVRNMLAADIPLITLEDTDQLGILLQQTGAQIVHSHHASVDNMVSEWIRGMCLPCAQVVSLHGMYETMNTQNCEYVFRNLLQTCGQFVYTADKNLTRIKELHYADKFPLVKVGNALPVTQICPIDRSELGIAQEDFVLCLVSRAIPEKGWQQAVDAVIRANKISDRKIHLLLIGEGPMKEKLAKVNDPCIHVVGQKPNIRDYFAMADMGFLPSVFRGESFPLVVIDSLLSGKPVLASDIGEIRNMLVDENQEVAGALFALKDWDIDIPALAEEIAQIAQKDEWYRSMAARVPGAAEKFDISRIVDTYLKIYDRVIASKETVK